MSGASADDRRLLETIACKSLPETFSEKLRRILTVVDEIKEEATKLGIVRNFTPDGRFLGDFGEVLAKVHFGVDLHHVQTEGEDGTCSISGKIVEVKLRSKSTLVWVKKVPDILLAIYLSPTTLKWGVVCNGPGKDLLADAKWDERHNRYVTNLTKLHRAQAKLCAGADCLQEAPEPIVVEIGAT